MTVTENILSMKSMMQSIFCYGDLKKDNDYLDSYRAKLTEDDFNKTFDEYAAYLKATYTIDYNTYTDCDGCTYNRLVKNNETPD